MAEQSRRSRRGRPLRRSYLVEITPSSISEEQQQELDRLIPSANSFIAWLVSAAGRQFLQSPQYAPGTAPTEYCTLSDASNVSHHEFVCYHAPRDLLCHTGSDSGHSTHSLPTATQSTNNTHGNNEDLLDVLHQYQLIPDIENISINVDRISTETSATAGAFAPGETSHWILAVFYGWNEITRTMDATFRTILLSFQFEALRSAPIGLTPDSSTLAESPLRAPIIAPGSTAAVSVTVGFSYHDLVFNHRLWEKVKPSASISIDQTKQDIAKYNT